MLTDQEIIDRMIERAEEKADEHHETMMFNDEDYFIEHSEYLVEYLDSREKFRKELHKYGYYQYPEDFL